MSDKFVRVLRWREFSDRYVLDGHIVVRKYYFDDGCTLQRLRKAEQRARDAGELGPGDTVVYSE